MLFSWGPKRESLRGPKPKRARVSTRTKPSGSDKRYGFTYGEKPLEHRWKAEKVFQGSARAEGTSEKVYES